MILRHQHIVDKMNQKPKRKHSSLFWHALFWLVVGLTLLALTLWPR